MGNLQYVGWSNTTWSESFEIHYGVWIVDYTSRHVPRRRVSTLSQEYMVTASYSFPVTFRARDTHLSLVQDWSACSQTEINQLWIFVFGVLPWRSGQVRVLTGTLAPSW